MSLRMLGRLRTHFQNTDLQALCFEVSTDDCDEVQLSPERTFWLPRNVAIDSAIAVNHLRNCATTPDGLTFEVDGNFDDCVAGWVSKLLYFVKNFRFEILNLHAEYAETAEVIAFLKITRFPLHTKTKVDGLRDIWLRVCYEALEDLVEESFLQWPYMQNLERIHLEVVSLRLEPVRVGGESISAPPPRERPKSFSRRADPKTWIMTSLSRFISLNPVQRGTRLGRCSRSPPPQPVFLAAVVSLVWDSVAHPVMFLLLCPRASWRPNLLRTWPMPGPAPIQDRPRCWHSFTDEISTYFAVSVRDRSSWRSYLDARRLPASHVQVIFDRILQEERRSTRLLRAHIRHSTKSDGRKSYWTS